MYIIISMDIINIHREKKISCLILYLALKYKFLTSPLITHSKCLQPYHFILYNFFFNNLLNFTNMVKYSITFGVLFMLHLHVSHSPKG